MKKLFNTCKLIVKIAISFVIISFLLTVALQRLTNNEISFFNYRIFSVQTGSMVPKYEIGDVLISKDIDPKDIKIGDAVSYLGKSGGFKNLIITHEVIAIEEEDGKLVFRTKGISNPAEDPKVYEDQVYGVITYKVKTLSYFYKIISTPMGMYLCIILPILFIIGYEILSRLLEREEEKHLKRSK